MDRLVDAALIRTSFKTDSLGQRVPDSETLIPVVGVLSSVSRQEWHDAAQQGLQAQHMIKLADSEDYEGEVLIELSDGRYVIYRTYETNDGGIELYLRRDAGAVMANE